MDWSRPFRGSALRGDRTGVEELPLRLLATIIVFALVLPVVFGMISVYSSAELQRTIMNSSDRIFAAARQAYDGTNGTSFVVTVNFRGTLADRVESLSIGDALGGRYEHAVRFKVSGRAERVLFLAGEPQPALTTFANRSLALTGGSYTLIVQHWKVGPRDFVVVDREFQTMKYDCFESPSQQC